MKILAGIAVGTLLVQVAGAAEQPRDERERQEQDQAPAAAAEAAPATAPSTPQPASDGGGGGGGSLGIDLHFSGGGGGNDGEAVLIVLAAVGMIVGPLLVTGDDYSTTARYPAHPYPANGGRYLRLGADGNARRDGHVVGGRLALDALLVREGQVVGADALVEVPARFGVAADWHLVHAASDREGALPQAFGGGSVTFRFAQATWAEFRVGLGVRTVRDGHPMSGVAYRYDAEFFPVRPLTVGLHWDWCKAGARVISEMRATAGLTWRGGEVYGGYSRLRYDNRAVDGPVAGARWWF